MPHAETGQAPDAPPDAHASGRSLSAAAMASLLALSLILAAGVAMKPVPVMALLVAGGFFALCLVRPAWALGAFLFVHIAYPAYIRIPPGLPPSIHMMMALAAALVLAAMLGTGRRLPRLDPIGRRLALLLALFAAIGLISLLDPRSTADSLNMWIKMFFFPGVTAWLAFRTLGDADEVRPIVSAMLVATCLTAAFGVYEYGVGSNYLFENFMDANLNDTSMYRTSDVLGPAVAYRSFGTSSQPIEFGAWLSMMLPFALVRFARARGTAAKMLYALACATIVLGVLVTFSRGCLLAVAITILVLGVVVRPLRAWLVAGAASAALGLAAIWPYVAEKVADRAGDVDNVTLRFKLWQTAIAIFQDHPFAGVGIGNFPQYQLDAVRQHGIGPFFEFGLDHQDLVGVAENTYFQLAAETGLIGLAAGAAFVGAFFLLAGRLAYGARTVERRDLALCIAAGGLAYFVNGLTITAYTHYITTLLFFGTFVGFLLILLRAESAGTATAALTAIHGNQLPHPAGA